MPQMSKRLKGRSVLTLWQEGAVPSISQCRCLLWKHALLPMRSGSGAPSGAGGSSAGTKQYRVLEIVARAQSLVELALYRAFADFG